MYEQPLIQSRKIDTIFFNYTLIMPFIPFLLGFLNQHYGAICADSCTTHSHLLYILIQGILIAVGIINPILYKLANKQNIPNIQSLYWLSILNFLSCICIFLFNLNMWMTAIILIPFPIILLLQFILLIHIIRKNIIR